MEKNTDQRIAPVSYTHLQKSTRLAELDAALNMEDTLPEHEEVGHSEKPSVLADLKSKSEHVIPYRASVGREEVLC